jgi:Tat protein secretion system quality control protein TatD with DNase activity
VEVVARKGECVGILTGLNFSRPQGSHFAQETLFRASYKLAEKLELPLVLYNASDGTSMTRAMELLEEEGWDAAKIKVIVHDVVAVCGCDTNILANVVAAGLLCSVSSSGISDLVDEAIQIKAKDCVKGIPMEQLLTCSNSPWNTPQNLADEYLRTLRNEPSTIASLYQSLEEIYNVKSKDLAKTVMESSLTVFGLKSKYDNANGPAECVEVIQDEEEDGEEVEGNDDEEGGDRVDVPGGADDVSTLTATMSSVNLTTNITTPPPPPTAAGAATCTIHYSCRKCRSKLFTHEECHQHGLSAANKSSSIIKAGEEGLCAAAKFLKGESASELESKFSSKLSIKGNVVECGQCKVKLGKFSTYESICPCGIEVEGPTVRIMVDKLDVVDSSLLSDVAMLTARSKEEAAAAAELRQQQEEEDLVNSSNMRQKKSKGKKQKMKAADNSGNFSSFRNKSFVKNASKVAVPDSSSGGGKKSNQQDKDDDDEEEDDE